jgi:hypothetical protein
VKILNERLSAVAMGAALLVAFGGASAVAAGMVTSADIKNDTVRSIDIRDDTVGLDDIRPGAEEALSSGGPETVGDLEGEFKATNPSVSMTPDGVEFGPYENGGQEGGSVWYDGLNGSTLSEVESLVYHARYTSTGDSGGVGVPYLRIFTDNGAGGENSAIFSPNTQTPDPDVAEGPFHEWVATSGTWRYNDDAGTGPDQSFGDLKAAHGDEQITGIYISTGFSNGQNLSALLRSWEINGTTYDFGG